MSISIVQAKFDGNGNIVEDDDNEDRWENDWRLRYMVKCQECGLMWSIDDEDYGLWVGQTQKVRGSGDGVTTTTEHYNLVKHPVGGVQPSIYKFSSGSGDVTGCPNAMKIFRADWTEAGWAPGGRLPEWLHARFSRRRRGTPRFILLSRFTLSTGQGLKRS